MVVSASHYLRNENDLLQICGNLASCGWCFHVKMTNREEELKFLRPVASANSCSKGHHLYRKEFHGGVCYREQLADID